MKVKNGLKMNCIFVETKINAAIASSSSVQNNNLEFGCLFVFKHVLLHYLIIYNILNMQTIITFSCQLKNLLFQIQINLPINVMKSLVL